MCESVSAQVGLLLDLRHSEMTLNFLHALSNLLCVQSNEETKFLALRCFSDITVAFINEERSQNPQPPTHDPPSTALEDLLVKKFFPKLQMLLSCSDPVPSVAMRLLSSIFDAEAIPKTVIEAVQKVKEAIVCTLSSQALSIFGANVGSSLLRLGEIKAADLSEVYVRIGDMFDVSSVRESSTSRIESAHLSKDARTVECDFTVVVVAIPVLSKTRGVSFRSAGQPYRVCSSPRGKTRNLDILEISSCR